ncbi:MAG: BON domain-containing protein [Chloroflexota bacterium]|nr:BON domain-containing protein [Chloroflexota bacterium]
MTGDFDRVLEPSEDEPEMDPLDPEAGMARIAAPALTDAVAEPETAVAYAGDGGDLIGEPPTGDTDDPLVAVEEGVPYVPPSDRVLSDVRADEAGPDLAGTAPDDAGELGRDEAIQSDVADPRDGQLQSDVVEALRASDIASGERLAVSVAGDVVTLRGQVESVDILDEVLAIVGDVPGVGEVVDEVDVIGV